MYYQLFNDDKKYIFSNINNLDTLNKHDIELLNCSSNQLTQLPQLPSNLKKLYCGFNQLTELPLLPNSLIHLYCENNKLTQLPQLPDNLIELYCEK